jgi:hypothetical protein
MFKLVSRVSKKIKVRPIYKCVVCEMELKPRKEKSYVYHKFCKTVNSLRASQDTTFNKMFLIYQKNVKILKELSEDPSVIIRSRVVLSPQTPKSLIIKLSNDRSDLVRQRCITNLKFPVKLLRKFINDPSPEVRRELISLGRTPKYILKKLTQDKDIHVADEAQRILQRRYPPKYIIVEDKQI